MPSPLVVGETSMLSIWSVSPVTSSKSKILRAHSFGLYWKNTTPFLIVRFVVDAVKSHVFCRLALSKTNSAYLPIHAQQQLITHQKSYLKSLFYRLLFNGPRFGHWPTLCILNIYLLTLYTYYSRQLQRNKRLKSNNKHNNNKKPSCR